MYAMLGQIPFEITHSFTSLDTTHKAKFVHHDVIMGKPRTQAMGHQLDKLKFAMRLHWRLGDVLSTYDALKTAQKSQDAQALITGSGEHLGWYVIESLSTTTTAQSDTGDVLAMDIDASLTEFGGDPNRPMPAPAIIKSGHPLLSLKKDSINAIPQTPVNSLLTDVTSYRRANHTFEQLQRNHAIAQQSNNDLTQSVKQADQLIRSTSSIIDDLQLPAFHEYKQAISPLSITCQYTQSIIGTLRESLALIQSTSAQSDKHAKLSYLYDAIYDDFKLSSVGTSKLIAMLATKKGLF